ncbi:hypothetical protein PM082_017158 [Marasmius tenuissimus]|nr:hypothetical protein PM082_017158 [Marasmius tenuissimus]
MADSSSSPPPTPTENQAKRDGPKYNGQLVNDAKESLTHLGAVPCARNSLLTGLASGAGMAFIRGVSVSPIKAGHWFAATFVLVSMGSWHICQNRIAEERQRVQQIVESSPKRVLKKESDDAGSASS